MKSNYDDFKIHWLPILRKQYQNGSVQQKRIVKENLYKNIQLKESQKDALWQNIISSSMKN